MHRLSGICSARYILNITRVPKTPLNADKMSLDSISKQNCGLQETTGSSSEAKSAPHLFVAPGESHQAPGEPHHAPDVSQESSDCAAEATSFDRAADDYSSADAKMENEPLPDNGVKQSVLRGELDTCHTSVDVLREDLDTGVDVLRGELDTCHTMVDTEVRDNSFEVQSGSQEEQFESCEEDETILDEGTSDAEPLDPDAEFKLEYEHDTTEHKMFFQSLKSASLAENNLSDAEAVQGNTYMAHNAELFVDAGSGEQDEHLKDGCRFSLISPQDDAEVAKEGEIREKAAFLSGVGAGSEKWNENLGDQHGLANSLLEEREKNKEIHLQSYFLIPGTVQDDSEVQALLSSSPAETDLRKIQARPAYLNSFPTEIVLDKERQYSPTDSSPSVVLLEEGELHSEPISSPSEGVSEKSELLAQSDSSPDETILDNGEGEQLSHSDSSPSVIVFDEEEGNFQPNLSPGETVLVSSPPISQHDSPLTKNVLDKEEALLLSDSSPSIVPVEEAELCSQLSSSPNETVLDTFEPPLQSSLQVNTVVLKKDEPFSPSPVEAGIETCKTSDDLNSSPVEDITLIKQEVKMLPEESLQPGGTVLDKAEPSPSEMLIETGENLDNLSLITVKDNTLPKIEYCPENGVKLEDAAADEVEDNNKHISLSDMADAKEVEALVSHLSSDGSLEREDSLPGNSLFQEVNNEKNDNVVSDITNAMAQLDRFEEFTSDTQKCFKDQNNVEQVEQLCTCSLIDQFNHDWSTRCGQLQSLTPDVYHTVLLEHLQFVQKSMKNQSSSLPSSDGTENRNVNSFTPGHEGSQPCPVHGLISQAEGSLLAMYLNPMSIPGGLLDGLSAPATSPAQVDVEISQPKKLSKLKERIEKELQNLKKEEKNLNTAMGEMKACKAKVEKEWTAYISQLHSRLDRQYQQAKEIFNKKHNNAEKNMKSLQQEAVSYRSQLIRLHTQVEAALALDRAPPPLSGHKTLKKELNSILSTRPELQVKVGPSYGLDLPHDINKNLVFIVGSVKVSASYSALCAQRSMAQKQDETKSEEKVSSAPHSKSVAASEHRSADAPQGEVLTGTQDMTSGVVLTKSRTVEVPTLTDALQSKGLETKVQITTALQNSASAEHVQIIAASQRRASVGSHSANDGSLQKDYTKALYTESSVAFQNTSVTASQNAVSSALQNKINVTSVVSQQSTSAAQDLDIGASQSSSTVPLQSCHVPSQQTQQTTLHDKTVKNLGAAELYSMQIESSAGQAKSALRPQTNNSTENKSVLEALIKSTTAVQNKNPTAPQGKTTAVLEFKKTPAPHNKNTNNKPRAASQSKGATKLQAKATTVSQSKSASASQKKTAVFSAKMQTAALQTKHAPDSQSKSSVASSQNKNTLDNTQLKTTQTHPPSVLPAVKENTVSSSVKTNATEKEAQSSQKAVFVPLTLVGPPVPRLADIKNWSSLPSLAHCPSTVPDLSGQTVIDQNPLAGRMETSSENVSTDSVASDTDSSSAHGSAFRKSHRSASLVNDAAMEERFIFGSFGDVQQHSFSDLEVGQSISNGSAAQKPLVSMPEGVTGLPRSGNPFGQRLAGSSSSGAKVTKKRAPRKRSRKGGKGKTKANSGTFVPPMSAMPRGIREDVGSSPATFKACGKEPTSFAPLPNGQVWLVYGHRDPHIDLMDEDGVIERVRIGGNTFHVSCMSDDCVVLLCHSPYPQLQLFDSSKKTTTTEMHRLDMKPTTFSVGFTGIAVCGYRSLLWITLHNGAKEWIVSEENSNFIKVCSCAVMFRNGSEVICVADKGGHAVFFFEKSGRGATSLEPYAGEGLALADEKQQFTPISISVHSAGFVGILDDASQSVLILDSQFLLSSVISRENLCCGRPSVIAFTADSSCKLWVASDPGPVCLAPLLFQI